jgi:hypothetical protein
LPEQGLSASTKQLRAKHQRAERGRAVLDSRNQEIDGLAPDLGGMTVNGGRSWIQRAEEELLSGPAPWWVGFPGSKVHDKPSGSRGFIVRSYRANFGGKFYDSPTLSLPFGEVAGEGRCHVDATLVAPTGIENYQAGDSVEMDIEIDVVPAEVDDYYGPNEAFRKHITENPGS